MARRQIRVVGAMIERDGRYFITQRPPMSSLPLLWEFPGGRVEPGETDEEALQRELREEMGIEVEVGPRTMHLEHAYPEYDIDFRVYACTLLTPDEDIRHIRIHDHRWVLPGELDAYEFPAADQRTLERLLNIQ